MFHHRKQGAGCAPHGGTAEFHGSALSTLGNALKLDSTSPDSSPPIDFKRAATVRQSLVARAARQRKQGEQWAENRRYLDELWSKCQPLTAGDTVTRYLHRRGFQCLDPLPGCLRYHPSLAYYHLDGRVTHHPAMVAPLIGQGGQIVALHRAYLTRDGRIAAVPSPNKMTRAAGQVSGSMIPLFKPDRGRLGIAKGIETALAARCASGLPVVASFNSSTLAAWTWPMGIQHLVVFADQDPAGLDAAKTLQSRARRYKLRCDVLTPSKPGQNWADAWAFAIADREEAWSTQ